jgi:hypothetical protein
VTRRADCDGVATSITPLTTAICGIHPKGKPPHGAAREIARTVAPDF